MIDRQTKRAVRRLIQREISAYATNALSLHRSLLVSTVGIRAAITDAVQRPTVNSDRVNWVSFK